MDILQKLNLLSEGYHFHFCDVTYDPEEFTFEVSIDGQGYIFAADIEAAKKEWEDYNSHIPGEMTFDDRWVEFGGLYWLVENVVDVFHHITSRAPNFAVIEDDDGNCFLTVSDMDDFAAEQAAEDNHAYEETRNLH